MHYAWILAFYIYSGSVQLCTFPCIFWLMIAFFENTISAKCKYLVQKYLNFHAKTQRGEVIYFHKKLSIKLSFLMNVFFKKVLSEMQKWHAWPMRSNLGSFWVWLQEKQVRFLATGKFHWKWKKGTPTVDFRLDHIRRRWRERREQRPQPQQTEDASVNSALHPSIATLFDLLQSKDTLFWIFGHLLENLYYRSSATF